MQTLVSLAKRLDMTADAAVEVLRKLQYDVSGVDSEIPEEAIDLLLDIDENPELLDQRLAKMEAEKEKERQKHEAAEKVKAKAKPKPKAKPEAKTKAKEKEQAEAEEEGEPKAKAKPKAKTKTAARKKAEEAEGGEAVKADEVSGKEQAEAVAEGAESAEAAEGMPITVPGAISGIEIPPTLGTPAEAVASVSVEAEKHVDKAHKPKAEIITASEEELLAERERKEFHFPEEEEPEQAGAGGVLAQAELRHEAEERRRHEREQKIKEQKDTPGARVSDVCPDPDVVARVIQRDQDRKRRQEEELQRRTTKKPKRKEEPPVSNAPVVPATLVAELSSKLKQKGDDGANKTVKKRVKRAERSRLREDNMRREAVAAVKEFQAGAVFGARKRRKRKREDSDIDDTQELLGGTIEVDEMATVESLAVLMEVSVSEIILELMDLNIMANKNQQLDMDTVRRVAEKFNYAVKVIIPEEEELFAEEPDNPEDLVTRPPVVTVMGHVDHGKTSLLDAIRTTRVAEGEAGGITQHIAAYDIEVPTGRVTFLDTPGHEAFTQMRARGANVTDIVVLVVAANDGVKPQTVEAIDHAKAAEATIVVAINKCDLASAQPDRVRQELTQHGLLDEAWGGKTIMRNISAKMKQGVDELMELLALQAEMLDLKANPKKRARGVIIEAELTTGLGPVAWVLVQSGTLRVGDSFLAGQTYGRIRSLTNCRGESVEEASPSTPVIVTGFSVTPDAGDTFIVAADERVARNIAEKRESRARSRRGPAARHITLEDFHARFTGMEQKVLHIILKADVQGSVESLQSSFAKLGNEEVSVNIVHAGVGGVNESDVLLAEASDAVIIGFHVTANAKVKKMAEQAGVEIRTYRIIYEALDDVRSALEGMLSPETREVTIGHAEVREVFKSSALGSIAGSYQTDGETMRGAMARIVRDGVIVHEGVISSLRRMKDDVRSVAAGYECGIKLERFEDIRVGDIVETYKHESIAKTLVQETT